MHRIQKIMIMGGSKKGEHRGNARKRPGKPGSIKPKPGWKRTHESPGEIMREAASKVHPYEPSPVVIERRITISRIISGESGAAEDTTPKEALLLGMHHNLQAFYDWRDMLLELAKLPATPENTLAVERCERECERLLDKVRDHARDAAPFIHPKLQATHVTGNLGANQATIMHELLTDVDELERNTPIPIEHKPTKAGGS